MTCELTCIVCPKGCQLTVELEGKNVLSVSGHTCKRGEAYAVSECTAPIGTNAAATAAMLKAGAKNAATGENPVVVACRKVDVIIGPVGIVIADSLLGEITEKMAIAVGQSDAVRILIPMNKCDNIVAGVGNLSTAALIDDAIEKLRGLKIMLLTK